MSRFLVAIMLVSVGAALAGCGGSDDGASSTTSADSSGSTDGGTVDSGESGETTAAPSGDDSDSSGDGVGTLTLADGTSYEFEMSSCDTSDNSDIFLVDPGYDLFGTAADGERLTLIRAGVEEESANPIGTLAIDDVDYNAVGEDDMTLEVDGGSVTGSVALSTLDSSAPLGEDFEATVAVSC